MRRQTLRRRLASATVALLLVIPVSATSVAPVLADDCPWMDTSLSADTRARLLLDASTLDQKMRWLDEQAANNPTQTDFNAGGGQTATYPAQVPCTPIIQYTDGPAAISGGGTGVTAFPAPDRPQRDLGPGPRPRQRPGPRRGGVRQAPQRHPWPGHRQRPRPALRPDVRVPRRRPAARRAHGRGPASTASRTTRRRSSPSSSTTSRTSRRSTARRARPTWTHRHCARSTRCRSRSRSRKAIPAASCAPSTRSITCTRARTQRSSPTSSRTRSGSTAGS